MGLFCFLVVAFTMSAALLLAHPLSDPRPTVVA